MLFQNAELERNHIHPQEVTAPRESPYQKSKARVSARKLQVSDTVYRIQTNPSTLRIDLFWFLFQLLLLLLGWGLKFGHVLAVPDYFRQLRVTAPH